MKHFNDTDLGAYGLGARIAAIRKKKGWTQSDLAERMQVSVQAVSKWETGASWPDVTSLPRLASLLGVSMDWLFGMDLSTPDPEQVLYASTGDSTNSDNTTTAEHSTTSDNGTSAAGTTTSDKVDTSSTDTTDHVDEATTGETAQASDTHAAGKTDEAGETGDAGGTGDAGETGDAGGTGDAGNAGGIGEAGDAGETGNAGETGDAGTTKDTGETGTTGAENEHHEETEHSVTEATAHIMTFGNSDIHILPGDDRDWGWEYTGEGKPPFIIEIRHGDIQVREEDHDQSVMHSVRRFFTKSKGALRLYCPTAVIDNLTVNAKGASNIDVDVPTRRADLQLKGTGDIRAKAVDDLKLKLTGVGNFKVGDLDTGVIEVPGVGSVDVARVTGRIKVVQRGVGGIKLQRGYLEHLTVNSYGVGSLHAEGVEILDADIRVKGVGDVKLGRVHKISLEQGQIGSVKYKLV